MDQQIEQYIQKLVTECLSSQLFLGITPEKKTELTEQLADYFYSMVMDTLLTNLNDEQLKELETVDFTSPAGIEKVQMLTAQIPNFLTIVDNRLMQEVEKIKSSGQIPEDPLTIP